MWIAFEISIAVGRIRWLVKDFDDIEDLFRRLQNAIEELADNHLFVSSLSDEELRKIGKFRQHLEEFEQKIRRDPAIIRWLNGGLSLLSALQTPSSGVPNPCLPELLLRFEFLRYSLSFSEN